MWERGTILPGGRYQNTSVSHGCQSRRLRSTFFSKLTKSLWLIFVLGIQRWEKRRVFAPSVRPVKVPTHLGHLQANLPWIPLHHLLFVCFYVCFLLLSWSLKSTGTLQESWQNKGTNRNFKRTKWQKSVCEEYFWSRGLCSLIIGYFRAVGMQREVGCLLT